MKPKSLIQFAVSTVLWLGVGGCSTVITNLTPDTLPENPSNIYTLSFRAKLGQSNVVQEALKAAVVIDGKEYEMRPIGMGKNIFEFDYAISPGQSEARYYFLIDYDYKISTDVRHNQKFSEVYDLRLINRYVIQLESTRGPVGAQVGILGSGFTEFETVLFNGVEVPTSFYSSNSIGFTVPQVPAGGYYNVGMRTGQGEMDVGTFKVDKANLTVLPGSLSFPSGERRVVVFAIEFDAPEAGIWIDVTTDIPESIIMPEVVIPGGARSANIPIEGGAPGTGSMFIEVAGFNKLRIPVSVY